MPAIDERARHELFVAVQDTLGSSHADTLMSLLPPVGWADVATKQDLHELEGRIGLRFERVNERFVELELRIDERFKGLDERFKGLDERFNAIDERFVGVDHRFKGLDQRMDDIVRQLEGMQQAIVVQGRSLMFGLVGTAVTMASFGLGALALAR